MHLEAFRIYRLIFLAGNIVKESRTDSWNQTQSFERPFRCLDLTYDSTAHHCGYIYHFIHFQPLLLNRTEKIFMEVQPSDSAFVDHDSFSCVSCGRGSNRPPTPHNSPSSLTPSQPDSASRLVSRWGWRLVSPARPSPFSFWIFEKYWQQFGEKLHKL